ncbi:MAG: 3-deoxy-D-manno-octulosonic acid transferase [Chitinophagaceae bacterium]|nr:3-deoxy-D-manno-octulosonic acid transferase [Chitinophagaceae bacterium]
MAIFFYNLFLFFYQSGIRIAALWNPKAALWVKGRRHWLNQVRPHNATGNPTVVWMHCASLGEFEQGRPLLELIRIKHPGVKIVISFFSPSGYEVMKGYGGADQVLYLPMDSPANARKFIGAINPSLVLWVKYEFWFHYLYALKQRKIPVLLVSGIFRQNQLFFKGYGSLWRKMLDCFSHFFVQNEGSEKLLNSIAVGQGITVSGDTRFDRVISIAEHFSPIPAIGEFCAGYPVMVAGSTWEEDEVELLHFMKIHPEIRFILVPHEVDEENLAGLRKTLPNPVFYSELIRDTASSFGDRHVLVIDNVGMLSRLYHYATLAYVGGGFGPDGVHNVLEAAVYGKPVVFGPVYEKFVEAAGLVESGGAVSIEGLLDLEAVLEELMRDHDKRKRMGEASRHFIRQHAGATAAILQYIQENRLLTS